MVAQSLLLNAPAPNHVGRQLGNVKSALYASKEYLARRGVPRDPRELAGHDLVGLAPEWAGAPEEQWLVPHGAGARVVVRAASTATQLSAIRAGLGLGVHACHAAEREPGVARVSDEIILHETYWAVVHVDMARSARVRAVLDLLSDQVAGRRAALEGERATAASTRPRCRPKSAKRKASGVQRRRRG